MRSTQRIGAINSQRSHLKSQLPVDRQHTTVQSTLRSDTVTYRDQLDREAPMLPASRQLDDPNQALVFGRQEGAISAAPYQAARRP